MAGVSAFDQTSFLSLLKTSGLAGATMSLILLWQEREKVQVGICDAKEVKYLWVLFPLMVVQLLISFCWGFAMEKYFEVSQEQELMLSLIEIDESALWMFSLVVVVMIVPLIEGMLFRGILIHVFCEKKISNVVNILCNGIFFGLMHMEIRYLL